MATVIWVMFLPMARRTVAGYAIASTRPRCDSSIATIWRLKVMGPILIKWRTSDDRRTRGSCRRLFLGNAGFISALRRGDLNACGLQRRECAQRDLSQSWDPCRSNRDYL